jgi:aryl-alcohol dehydrogenase-like predicted oxidoreductase
MSARLVLGQAERGAQLPLVTKPIPSSGERIPVVGLGTAQSWGATPRDQLATLLRRMPELGGKLVDTAPAYGQSEIALGEVVNQLQNRDRLFLATKVSVGGGRGGGRAADGPGAAQQGIASMEESLRRLHTTRIDLMQVWNLAGPDVLLPILREWKQGGRIRYYGVTTTFDGQYPALLELMRRERLDFVQVDYSINNRNAAQEVLPLAAERGIAVLTALPFGRTSAFQKVQNKPVPDWAKDIDCTTWAEIFLKYLVSHPAVTVAIPGTTSVDHLADNLGAARGRMPDAAMRQRIEREYDAL